MDALELQRIEQRLKEGYYEGDADTLRTMEELIQAIREIVAAGIPAEDIDERVIASHLYTRETPDPDLIIRTQSDWLLTFGEMPLPCGPVPGNSPGSGMRSIDNQ